MIIKILKKIKIYNNNELDKYLITNELIDEIEFSIPIEKIDMIKIPESVTTLKFNYIYNNLLTEIPKNVKTVYFYEFNNLLEDLPANIEHVHIYKGFNHPIDNLGNNFKSIDLGWDFNYPIDNLPSSLEKIILGKKFIHSINNLPINLKFLHIYNEEYNYITILNLPKSILFLQLSTNIDFELEFTDKKYICYLDKNFGLEKGYGGMNQYFKNFYFYK
jgi:hypothetical protein